MPSATPARQVYVRAGREIEAKRLQLLKEALPDTSRVAYLGMKSDWDGPDGEDIQTAARMLRVTLVHAEHTPNDYTDAFALMTRDRPHALFVARSVATYAKRQVIVNFTVEHRIPAMYPWRDAVEAGGLISYGTNTADLFRRAAEYVDRILKGEKPADLPVQQPTMFEL